MPFAVTYHPDAARELAALKAQADARPESAHAKRWKALRQVLVEVLPEHALAPQFAKQGRLVGIRAKHAGQRDRVVWIASAEKQAAVVLMVGFVKEGDVGDTYAVLSKLLRAGVFDAQFAELDLPVPPGE